MKLQVTYVYEYEVNLEHYDTDDPVKIAQLDLETDPAMTLMEAEEVLMEARFVS